MKTWECGVCGKRFMVDQSHDCRGQEVPFAKAVKKGNDISTPAGRISAGRTARDRRKKAQEDGELENVRQVIRELREEKTDQEKAWSEETRALEKCEKDRVKADEEIARLDGEVETMKQRLQEAEARGLPDERGCRAAREEAEKLRADVAGLELELDAVRSAMKANDELLAEERKVFMEFIGECAELLGLPKMDGCSEYGGGAIRKGIKDMKKKLEVAELTADGVIEGAEEWKDDCKTAQKELENVKGVLEVSEARRSGLVETISCYAAALEKINEIRNDVIGRGHMGWSKHIYPLVAALNEAGFEGTPYDRARARIEATMTTARMLVAVAWCSEKTEQTEMDVVLAEEFAEILFPFLETLEFYALPGHWQGHKEGTEESACEMDFGGRARATLGRPDRYVPEIADEDSDSGTGGGPSGDGT